MDSIYDPAEVYDVELLNDDDIDDNKSDQDNGECNISEGGTMDHQDASANKLLITDATENINMVDDGATNDGNTAAAEEDADGNKERFSRTERENMKVSVMQRLSPSIDSSLSRDTAKSGKGNYSRLIVLNLPVSCSVDQLKEFINSKLNSGVTLDKVEGIYVGAAMVWITPVSAIGEVASFLKDCVLDDRKVVARKMSSRDYDIFAQKKAKAMAGPQLQNKGARAAANGLWRAALRNINTSLSAEQLENIFKKRAEGVIKVQMIPDNKSGSNKKHIGRGHVTFETKDMAARFCRKIGNTIVGGRNVVARMETKPVKDQTKRTPGPARSSPKPASKLAPRPPHYRLTVTGVSVEVSAKELEEIFSSEVSSPVRANLAPTEGAPHAGTGFLEFRKEEAAYTAHTLLNGTDIGGSCITLTLDIEKGSEPEEEVEQEAAEGDSSDVMEISIQEPEKEEEQGLSLGQRSRSRDSDSRREREERNRKEERDNRDSERERDQERERRARARENDRDARVRSRSPLRTADRGGEGRRVEGVMILRNLDELRRKTRGARFRAHVSNIAYTMTEGKMISLINQQVTGLESILACQFSDGKFKGVMILEFVSPAAVENFIDKMASFNVNNRKIVIKRDSDNSLRDGRARRNSPPRSRDDRPPRPRDMSPMRQPHQMGHNPHVGPDRMGPDHMMRQGMQLGGPPMQASMGHPSQMGGMNQMMSGMDHRMNPAIGMAGGPQMGGPAYGPGQQMAGGFGMNRSLGGVSARLGDIMPAQSGLMDQGTAFMNAQQQQQQHHHQQPPPQQQQPPVVVVPETSQRQLVALPSTTGDVNTETYGLSTTFLASLNIKLPLVKELLVINLDSAATDADVKDLFSIAGTVSKIQYNKVKGQAIVEMAHPVEAVQAVSMLHNQEYFDRVLGVRLLRPNDPDNLVTRSVVPAVPRGLKTIGKGLGIDGLPLSTVLQPPVALTPQQQRQPQQSVIADPCMQRPPPNKASADKPLFAFPPPSQLQMQNVPPRRGQAAGTNKQGRDGRGDTNLFETSRKAEKKAERASRWERQNTYQKTAAPDTWATKRDSGSVDRDRQDGSDSSKNRFRESGDQGYCQPSTDRVMDMPRHYESVDANRNGPPRGRNISRGEDMNEGFGGGGGRQEDQYNNTNKSWINDRADFKNSSYGNQSESGRFSNNSSSNSGRDQGRASRDGLSWDDSGRSAPVKTPSSYGTDEENRNFSSDNQNRNYSSDNQNRNYSSDNQNRNYNYNNRSGGYPNGGGDSLNTSESKFSDSRASIATLGGGSRESSLLGGYAAQSRGGGFGSESAAGLAPSSSSLRSSLTSIMSSSNVGREVILSNLPSNAKQQTIVDMCLPYGVVRNVVLNSAQRSGRVVFDSYQQATMAADILNDQNYNGAVLSAMLA